MTASLTLRHVGKRMAELRRRAGLTQSTVAAKLGVTNETVSRLERGVQWTEFGTLVELATLYGVELPELLAAHPEDEDGQRRALVADVGEMLRARPLEDIKMAAELLRVVLSRLPKTDAARHTNGTPVTLSA